MMVLEKPVLAPLRMVSNVVGKEHQVSQGEIQGALHQKQRELDELISKIAGYNKNRKIQPKRFTVTPFDRKKHQFSTTLEIRTALRQKQHELNTLISNLERFNQKMGYARS